jgi:Tol biopolymer transport system component
LFPIACAPAVKRVVLIADGQRRVVDTQAATVADLLREQHLALGENDRVEPPAFTEIERSTTITLTRVTLKTETTTKTLSFTRKLIHDESLPDGQMRVAQLGTNGQAEVTIQVILENGQPVTRREIARKVITSPRDEILTLGTQGSLPTVPIPGSLFYLANGNAFVLRGNSNDKRPLTFTGDLDARVFDVSADGRTLLFSRAANADRLNSLWVVDTTILNEPPRPLPVTDVLYAQFAPNGENKIAYSTGEKTPGAPGWKAHNDLWIARLGEITATQTITLPLIGETRIVSASVPAPYAWWGWSLAWSPDAQVFAYAFADQVGQISAASGQRRVLAEFSPFKTRADWVWTPRVSWSPDARFIVTTLHGLPEGAGLPEDSPVFDVSALARDETIHAPLVPAAGMFAAPRWSPRDAQGESQIAYGVALVPSDSEKSRYALWVMDRDGSNKQKIFPLLNENDLDYVDVAWAPDTAQLVAIREGDVWLYDFARSAWSQLTANGDSRLPIWR